MKAPKYKKEIEKIHDKMNELNRMADLTRARSLLVGTCSGGITEVSMRSIDGTTYWIPLQPVEVIEIIHQLAAGVGCHINLQPRSDFSSWRIWSGADEQTLLTGHAPFPVITPSDKVVHLPSPEEQPGLNIKKESQDAVAVEKTINKRTSKRSTKIT
jgi:hypothetical protein